jgi:hypothetical protein
MSESERSTQRALVRATLEIDDGLAPGGSLTSAEGGRLAFYGWAELAAAIEEVRAGSRRASTNRTGEQKSDGEQIGPN